MNTINVYRQSDFNSDVRGRRCVHMVDLDWNKSVDDVLENYFNTIDYGEDGLYICVCNGKVLYTFEVTFNKVTIL